MASLALRSGLLGRRLAAHLLRRATFGPTRAEIDDLANRTADEAVDLLMNFPPLPNHPKDPATSAEWVVNGRTTANSPNNELKYIVNSWWLDFVLNPTTAFPQTQAILLLHTSFVTSFNDIL
ncbi:MAG: hypothetical protein R3B93_24690 [Bacteroidia bacterium]